jgi:hypothetical protein
MILPLIYGPQFYVFKIMLSVLPIIKAKSNNVLFLLSTSLIETS